MLNVKGREPLPPPRSTPPAGLDAVLDLRRSLLPKSPLSVADLSTVLWYAARIRHAGQDELKRPWSSRAAPGAGGVCEIDLVVDDGVTEPWLYDPRHHRSILLDGIDAESLTNVRSRLRSWAPDADGTALYFLADFAAMSARYEFPQTLIWRDAGALVAVVALVSAWLGLACCPLGLNGREMMTALRHAMPAHEPAGVVFLGHHA